jgi:hypothetical protein
MENEMLQLQPEHLRALEEIRKNHGRLALVPTNSPTAQLPERGDLSPVSSPDNSTSTILVRIAEAPDLMALLGFDNLSDHGREIKRFYLFGWCYHHGARSARHIVQMLGALSHLTTDEVVLRAINGLTTKPREAKYISASVKNLESMLSVHLKTEIRLVTQDDKYRALDGLTEVGERFWQLVSAYLARTL